jgi:hypothetical protein
VPHHWIRIPTGTPPEIAGLADDPHGYEQAVADIVLDEGGGFDGVWFDTDEPQYAYVLVHGAEGKHAEAIAGRLKGKVTNLESVPERIRSLRNPPPEGPSAA